MKQGTSIHKILEDEVHTTVPVEITTKEDGWALRIWNVIQGLRTLREFGLTRELEVWGVVDGEIVTGVIDQLSYECPDTELEASAATFYTDAAEARAALPEYQMSITDYLLSPSRKGVKLSEWGQQADEHAPEVPSTQDRSDICMVYVTDIKTRASRSIPTVASSSFRPTKLQLELYYHMLNRMTTSDEVTMDMLAQRYGLDPERQFSDGFVAEVGGLNDQFFDAISTQMSNESSIPGASQDSMTILLAHNNLASLWKLMKEQLRSTFLPQNYSSSNPESLNRSQLQPPHELLESYNTTISPVLTAMYLSSQPPSPPPTTEANDQANPYEHDPDYSSPTVLGSRSFLFDPVALSDYLSDQMTWWRGHRVPRGVDIGDAVWKCRMCEFREGCEWRRDKENAYLSKRRNSAGLSNTSGNGAGRGGIGFG
jgi:exonuclease V